MKTSTIFGTLLEQSKRQRRLAVTTEGYQQLKHQHLSDTFEAAALIVASLLRAEHAAGQITQDHERKNV